MCIVYAPTIGNSIDKKIKVGSLTFFLAFQCANADLFRPFVSFPAGTDSHSISLQLLLALPAQPPLVLVLIWNFLMIKAKYCLKNDYIPTLQECKIIKTKMFGSMGPIILMILHSYRVGSHVLTNIWLCSSKKSKSILGLGVTQDQEHQQQQDF